MIRRHRIALDDVESPKRDSTRLQLHDAALRTNQYCYNNNNNNDGMFLSTTQLPVRHIRRRKQRRETTIQRIQLFFFKMDAVGRIALIASSVLLCCWMAQMTTLRHMVTERLQYSSFHPRTKESLNQRILHQPETINVTSTNEFTVVFSSKLFGHVKHHVIHPSSFPLRKGYPDFGGIDLKIAEDKGFRLHERTIYHDYHADVGYAQMLEEHDDDEEVVESYYAFDDDTNRNPYVEYDDPDIHRRKKCRRTNWHRDVPVMCNSLHEFDVPNNVAVGNTKFLSSGAYRKVYLTTVPSSNESSVLKMLTLDSEFSYDDYEFVRMDANVNEKLNRSHRIVSIYLFCGISIVGEAMLHGDLEKYAVPTGIGRPTDIPNADQPLTVRNTLSGTQKLEWSLDMAEAVHLLHTFSGGVIVHDDIQPSQFLLSSTGQMKLNDFNRAEIMLWNEKDGEYCKYRNHPGGGDWRSPEEYLDRPLDETIDIWSLGNNMYTLLTGLYPFYDSKEQDVSRKVVDGLTAHIDPRHKDRSFAEAKLAEIIPQCWIYDSNQRIDIIQLVKLLRGAVEENKIVEVARYSIKLLQPATRDFVK